MVHILNRQLIWPLLYCMGKIVSTCLVCLNQYSLVVSECFCFAMSQIWLANMWQSGQKCFQIQFSNSNLLSNISTNYWHAIGGFALFSTDTSVSLLLQYQPNLLEAYLWSLFLALPMRISSFVSWETSSESGGTAQAEGSCAACRICHIDLPVVFLKDQLAIIKNVDIIYSLHLLIRVDCDLGQKQDQADTLKLWHLNIDAQVTNKQPKMMIIIGHYVIRLSDQHPWLKHKISRYGICGET